jgi:hypothetical protein
MLDDILFFEFLGDNFDQLLASLRNRPQMYWWFLSTPVLRRASLWHRYSTTSDRLRSPRDAIVAPTTSNFTDNLRRFAKFTACGSPEVNLSRSVVRKHRSYWHLMPSDLIHHQINNHAGHANIKPQRQRPAGNDAVLIEAVEPRPPQCNQNHRHNHDRQHGVRSQ